MTDKYDKYGNPIDLEQWAKLFEDEKYKRIGLDKLWWGANVSTVWLGLDHSFETNVPLFYETMVFFLGHDIDINRYGGLADARNGHIHMIQKWSKPSNAVRAILRRLKKGGRT